MRRWLLTWIKTIETADKLWLILSLSVTFLNITRSCWRFSVKEMDGLRLAEPLISIWKESLPPGTGSSSFQSPCTVPQCSAKKPREPPGRRGRQLHPNSTDNESDLREIQWLTSDPIWSLGAIMDPGALTCCAVTALLAPALWGLSRKLLYNFSLGVAWAQATSSKIKSL